MYMYRVSLLDVAVSVSVSACHGRNLTLDAMNLKKNSFIMIIATRSTSIMSRMHSIVNSIYSYPLH